MKALKRVLISTVAVAIGLAGAFAQAPSQNWMLLDYQQNGVPGVSSEKAYTLLKDRTPKKVVVAVIDSGVDVDHEDLKEVIWVNPGEIAGNGIDDDKNGYIDDINGWNFIGGKDGKNVDHDTYEMTRLYVMYSAKFGGKTRNELKGNDKKQFDEYLVIKEEIDKKRQEFALEIEGIEYIITDVNRTAAILKEKFGIDPITAEKLSTLKPDNDTLATSLMTLNLIMGMMGAEDHVQMIEGLNEALEYYNEALEYSFNPAFDPRPIVGDDYTNSSERHYGNNDVKGPDPGHGTHVSGIIAGKRNNGVGIDGISDNTEIMVLRTVPNGDERDKDVANAIIYAADNGARIINMSFGKAYSYDKAAVDYAVKYAEKKGVLLIHAAGNESLNLDSTKVYPMRKFEKGGASRNWLEVGAMGWEPTPNMVGDFSNYGKKSVDLFAPGVDIYSTVPGNEYKFENGTSMAAPSASGVAAVLMSYFPDLSAAQVRQIMMSSVYTFPDVTSSQPGSEKGVKFSDLSVSGGAVNLYNAVQLALRTSKIK